MRREWNLGIILTVFLMFFAVAGAQLIEGMALAYHLTFQPQDFSARIYGMGGVSTADARGAEAVFSNPAGMALDVEDSEILLTGRAHILGKPTQYKDKDVYENIGLENYSSEFGFHPSLSNFSVNIPYRLKDSKIDFAGGMALRRYFDLGLKVNESAELAGYEVEVNTKAAGVLNLLTFAGAMCYRNMFSGGFSIGFSFMSKYTGMYEAEYDTVGFTYKEEYREEYKDISGSVFRFGGVVNPVPNLAFGLTYTGGFDLEFDDGEYKYEMNGYEDEGEIPDVEVEVPSYFSLGAAFSPTELITLAAEYQTRPWEDIDIAEDDGFSLRFGGSLNFGTVAVRAGYIMDKGYFTDEDEDLVGIHTFTGGIGFGTDIFSVDLGLGYSMANWELGEDVTYSLLQAKLSATYKLPLFFNR